MEEDALQVLKFMASNGLIANPKKTAMLFLNTKKATNGIQVELKIGKELVKQDHNAKLLGIIFNDKQKWNDQVFGKGGVINSLNQKIFLILRLRNFLNNKALIKVAESIFMSKIRYGIQLLGKVRLTTTDSINQELEAIQRIQNKLVRILNGVRLMDKISAKSLAKKLGLLSVNQINAQVKLTEMWKAINNETSALQISIKKKDVNAATTRADKNVTLMEHGLSELCKKTFLNDAAHVWNVAPEAIKESKSLYTAKKAIKLFVQTLPF